MTSIQFEENFDLFHSNVNGLESHFEVLHKFVSNCPSEFDLINITETSQKIDEFLSNINIAGSDSFLCHQTHSREVQESM